MRLRSTALSPRSHDAGPEHPPIGLADDTALPAMLVADGRPADPGLEAIPARQRATSRTAFPLLTADDPRIDPRVVAAFDARNDAVARVRDLRSALSSRWHADAPGDRRMVALVGLDPSVEVAVVAANLAVVSAQFGWRTLLIDGDLEAPAQDELFRLPNEAGLSTLLRDAGQAPAGIQPTAIEGLTVLTAGPSPLNPAELLDRQPLLDAIDGYIGRHRLVVLSLPARAQSARFDSLATILSGFDGALVLANRHTSGLRPLQRLTAMMAESGVPLLGTVIVP